MCTLKLFCLTAAFMLCAAVGSAGQLTILTEDSPPGSFIDESGELKGLSVDIVKEIMKRLDMDNRIKVLPWARSYRMLIKEPDIMLFSTTRTAQRESLFKWVGPLIKLEWVFLARKDSNVYITCLDDARSVNSIGTYREDARQQYLKAKGFTNLHSTNEMPLLIRMLDKKRLDLVATSKFSFKECCNKSLISWDKFKVVYTFKKATLYMAFSQKTDDTIVRQWQQVYDELSGEGFIDAVNKKWLR